MTQAALKARDDYASLDAYVGQTGDFSLGLTSFVGRSLRLSLNGDDGITIDAVSTHLPQAEPYLHEAVLVFVKEGKTVEAVIRPGHYASGGLVHGRFIVTYRIDGLELAGINTERKDLFPGFTLQSADLKWGYFAPEEVPDRLK